MKACTGWVRGGFVLSVGLSLACGLGSTSEGDAAIAACGASALAAAPSFQGVQWHAVSCSVGGLQATGTYEQAQGDSFRFHATLADPTRALVELGPVGSTEPCLKLATEQDLRMSSSVPVWYGGDFLPPLDANTHCVHGERVLEGRPSRGPLTLFVKGNEVWGYAVATQP